MGISVVQFKGVSGTVGGVFTGNFTSNVSIGNSIILWTNLYNTSGNAISTSSPLYNGAPVTGAVKLFEKSDTDPNQMYFAIWLLPNVQSSGTSISFSQTNSNTDGNAGFMFAEVAGLGTAPTLDSASPNPATNSNNGTANPSSGATGNIVSSSALIVGGVMCDNAGVTAPGAPWTTGIGTGFGPCGYQIATSSGGSYTFTATAGASQWSAGVAAIQPGGIIYNTGANNTAAAAAHTFQPTLTVPAGVLVNDMMLVSVSVFTFTPTTPDFTITATSGHTWTPVGPGLVTSGANGGLNLYSRVWSRVATSGDAGDTLTFAFTGTQGSTDQFWWAIPLVAYTGAGSVDVVATPVTNNTSHAASPTMPSVLTGVNGDWKVNIGAIGVDSGGSVNLPPSGTTMRENPGTSGVWCSVADSNTSVGNAGTSIGGGSYALSGTTSWAVGWTIGLAPASGSTPVSGSDTGSGTDAAVSIGISGSDTASGADAAVSIGLSNSDTASGADTGSVAAHILDSDTGSGTETGSTVVEIAGADVAAGTDFGSVSTGQHGTGGLLMACYP